METVGLWPINSLPVPFAGPLGQAQKEEEKIVQNVDHSDNFSKGEIVRYFPSQKYGFVRTVTGKEIYFKMTEMDIAGAKKAEALKEGITVGFDVAESGHGLHVKKMKIY